MVFGYLFLAQTDTNPLTNSKSMFQHSILLLHSSSRFRRTNRWVLFAKVFSTKFEGMASVGVAKGSNPRTFLSENRIFHQFTKVFSHDIFPLYGTYKWRGLHSTVCALSLKVSLSVFNLSNFLYINIWCPDRQWGNQTNNVLGVCCVTTQTKSLGERTKSAVIKF